MRRRNKARSHEDLVCVPFNATRLHWMQIVQLYQQKLDEFFDEVAVNKDLTGRTRIGTA